MGAISFFLPLSILSFSHLKHYVTRTLYRLSLALVFICLGSLILALNSYKNEPEHFSKLTDNECHNLILRIEKRLKSGLYQDKYYAEILQLDRHTLKGRLLVNIEAREYEQPLKVDDILVVTTALKPIQTPLNPHQFNYNRYLKNHGIARQIYLDSSNYKAVVSQPTSVYGYADALRIKINESLKESGFTPSTIQMINALLLGQKQDIDPNIYNNYINVGTVHILAVSGLHVGIILWILTWLFKPLLYFKYGRYLRVSLILLLLWSFAFVTGLSPSVSRAVTMFSLLSIAQHLRRETNIINTVVTSGLLLILINPYIIFDVGFQLSYTAVLSIVAFQPPICSLWQPNIQLLNYLWQIFGVTLAAQLGVAPLSLFYFHQFPGLFFVSNLVVVPVVGLILGFGLCVIALSLLNSIPEFLVHSFEKLISTLNQFIAWVAQFESFLFRDIRFDFAQVIMTYIIFIALYWAHRTKQWSWMTLCLFTIIGFQAHQLFRILKPNNYPFIVFNKSRHSIIGQQKDHKLLLYHSMADTLLNKQQFLKNYRIEEGLTSITSKHQQRVFAFQNELVLVIDSTSVYKELSFKPTIILLQYSPKLNLERLLKLTTVKLVVADASNYKSYVKRWKNTCQTKNIPFYNTAKAGALVWPN